MNEDQLVLIGQVAHRVARVWPDVQPEDLRNELVVKWLESEAGGEEKDNVSVLDYWNDEDTKRGQNKLRKTLDRWAHGWCRKETAAIRGNDDYHQYDRRSLKLMLPLLHDPQTWGSLAVHGSGGKRSQPAHEGGDSLASYADLMRAWRMLTEEQRACLAARYVWELDDWCEILMMAFGCTAAAAAKRVSRALDALERALAGRPAGERGRTVMTNAAAQSITSRDY